MDSKSLQENNRQVIAFVASTQKASLQEVASFAVRVADPARSFSAMSGGQTAYMSVAMVEVTTDLLQALEAAKDKPEFDAAVMAEARLVRSIVMNCQDSAASTNPFANLLKQYLQSSAGLVLSRLKLEGLIRT